MFTNVSVQCANIIQNKLIHVIYVNNTECFYWIIRFSFYSFTGP